MLVIAVGSTGAIIFAFNQTISSVATTRPTTNHNPQQVPTPNLASTPEPAPTSKPATTATPTATPTPTFTPTPTATSARAEFSTAPKKFALLLGIETHIPSTDIYGWGFDILSYTAAHFDMIVTGDTVDNLAELKALNPSIKVLAYRDMLAADNWCLTNAPEEWFCHDTYGNRLLTAPDLWSWYLMDISNPDYRQYVIDKCANICATYGYDGIFADDPWFSMNRDWFTWKFPDNTILQYPNWVNDMRTLLIGIKLAINPKLLIPNDGAGSSISYSDGVTIENWVQTPYFGDPADWVNHFYQLCTNNPTKIVVAVCHLPMNMTYDDFKFSFGCFLLAKNGNNAYFNWINIWQLGHGWFPEMDIDTGVALGPYYVQSDGLYVRNFTNLEVVVDMTARTAQLLQ